MLGKKLKAEVSVKLSENQWYQIAAVVRPWSRSVSFYVDGTIVENAKIMDDLDFFEDCTQGGRFANLHRKTCVSR